MQNDPTFITNQPGFTVLERFRKNLWCVKFFDIRVGSFCTRDFDKLHESSAFIEPRLDPLLPAESKFTGKWHLQLNVTPDELQAVERT